MLGVTEFNARNSADDGPPLDDDPLNDLPYETELTELANLFRHSGFTVRHANPDRRPPDDRELTAAYVAELSRLGPGDLLVVHVLSHGRRSKLTNSLFVAGANGCDEHADLADWIRAAEEKNGPDVLFLLDICHAGRSIDIHDSLRATDDGKVWLLAASQAGEPAFDARFTRALVEAIRVIETSGHNEHGLDPRHPEVSLREFARAVSTIFGRLVSADGGDPQKLRGSRHPLFDDNDSATLFVNRFHVRNMPTLALPEATRNLTSREVAHFTALASGQVPGTSGRVRFTGRASQLGRLAGWLSDPGDTPTLLVSGRPGTGKSALVSVLACAIHGEFSAELRKQLRELLPGVVPRNDVAVIDARHRAVSDFEASVARQLLGAADVRGRALVARLSARPPAVVVVDGLDEAITPVEILRHCLRPLVEAGAVRLLVTSRTGSPVDQQLRDLLSAADDAIIDLDHVDDIEALEDDIANYARALLSKPGNRDSESVAAKAVLAANLAAHLVAVRDSLEWGEFLITRLYVQHLVENDLVESDQNKARRQGRAAPVLLSELFEKDSAITTGGRFTRPVLCALAHAPVEGMPVVQIAAVAVAFAPSPGPAPTDVEVVDVLTTFSRYIRASYRDDGNGVEGRYQLFHDGLAAHLRKHPFTADEEAEVSGGRILDALVASVPHADDGTPDWRRAPDYLRGHVLELAFDAGRLDEFAHDAAYLLSGPEVQAAVNLLAARDATSLMTAIGAFLAAAADVPDDPDRLALEAARAGLPHLTRALAGTDHLLPVFVTRRHVTPESRRPVTGGLAVASLGRTVVLQGFPGDAVPVELTVPERVRCLCVGEVDGEPIVVAGLQNQTVSVWRRRASTWHHSPLADDTGQVNAVAIVRSQGTTLIVTGNELGRITFWDTENRLPKRRTTIHVGPIRGLVAVPAGTGDDLVIVSSERRTVLVDPSDARTFPVVPAGRDVRLPFARSGVALELRIPPSGALTLIDLETAGQVELPVPDRSWHTDSRSRGVVVVGGRHLVRHTDDDRLCSLDLDTGRVRLLVTPGTAVRSMTSLGDDVVGVCVERRLEVRSATGTSLYAHHAFDQEIGLVAGAVSHDRGKQDVVGAAPGFNGLVLAVPAADGVTDVHVIGAAGRRRSRTLTSSGQLLGVAAANGWAIVACHDGAGPVRAWHPVTGREVAVPGYVGRWLHTDAPDNVAMPRTEVWLPVDGEFGWLAADDDGLLFTPTPHGPPRRLVEADTPGVTALDAWIEPSGVYAVTGDAEGMVRLWDLESGMVGQLSAVHPVIGIRAPAGEGGSPDHIVVVTAEQVVVTTNPRGRS